MRPISAIPAQAVKTFHRIHKQTDMSFVGVINLAGKATIHRAAEFKQTCLDAVGQANQANLKNVEINWVGALALDASILQLLFAVAREKEICSTGDPCEAIRHTLTLAGVDASLRPLTSNPE